VIYQGQVEKDQIGYNSAWSVLATRGQISHLELIPSSELWLQKSSSSDSSARISKAWDKIRKIILEQKIDVLFLQYFHSTLLPDPSSMLQRIREMPNAPIIVTSCGDPYSPHANRPPISLVGAASKSDLVVSTSMGSLARIFQKAGARRVSLLPNSACDIRFGQDLLEPESEWDVVFIGSRYSGKNFAKGLFWTGKQRETYVQELARKFGPRLAIFGKGWADFSQNQGPVDYKEQVRVANLGKVVFEGVPGSKLQYYTSDRVPIQMLSARPLVMMPVEGLNSLFEPGRHYSPFTNASELVTQIGRLLDNPGRGLEIGDEARDLIKSHHMNSHRVELLYEWFLEIIEARRQNRIAQHPRMPFLTGTQGKPSSGTSVGW
jgi:hypothetical protein